MKKTIQKILILCSIFILFGCATTDEYADKHNNYQGAYTVGFESSSFTPIGKKEKWWLSFAKGVDLSKLQSWQNHAPKHAYITHQITVKGKISPKGNYGHMGMFQRQIVVSEIIEVK